MIRIESFLGFLAATAVAFSSSAQAANGTHIHCEITVKDYQLVDQPAVLVIDHSRNRIEGSITPEGSNWPLKLKPTVAPYGPKDAGVEYEFNVATKIPLSSGREAQRILYKGFLYLNIKKPILSRYFITQHSDIGPYNNLTYDLYGGVLSWDYSSLKRTPTNCQMVEY